MLHLFPFVQTRQTIISLDIWINCQVIILPLASTFFLSAQTSSVENVYFLVDKTHCHLQLQRHVLYWQLFLSSVILSTFLVNTTGYLCFMSGGMCSKYTLTSSRYFPQVSCHHIILSLSLFSPETRVAKRYHSLEYTRLFVLLEVSSQNLNRNSR